MTVSYQKRILDNAKYSFAFVYIVPSKNLKSREEGLKFLDALEK